MSSNEIAIKVEKLSKCYQIYDKPNDRLKQFVLPRVQKLLGQRPTQYFRGFWALKDVSFEIKKGETVGIIGRNGSGKSTLLQLICGTLNPSSGSIQTNGRIAALLELGSGFNPEFTGRENVYMNAAILGLSNKEVDERFDSIAAFADIGQFIEQPVKTYSSGMYVRLAFAVNIISEPEIMIVDEALAVGDMAFQAKCMTALTRIQDCGTTVLFVSHDIGALKSLCSRGIYLERGNIQAIGKAPDVAEQYIKNMREEMNAEHSNFISMTTEPKLKNQEVKELDAQTPRQRYDLSKRSDEFDIRVAAFRYGSGEAKITFVELLNMDDEPIQALEFNQEVKINIFFECYTNEKLYVFFGVMDEKKNLITGSGQIELGQSLIETKNGDCFMVSYKTKLPLSEGEYSILAQLSKPIIHDETAYFIDVVDNAVVFLVNRRINERLWVKVFLFPECEIRKLTN